MIEITYFIKCQDLKDYYGFDENVEENYIKNLILKSQDFIIRPLLGETLWATYVAAIDAFLTSGTPLPTLINTIIYTHIQPIIAYDVKSQLVYDTAFKIKNEGIENGSKFGELVQISKKYKIDSNEYLDRLKQFMLLYYNMTPDYLYKKKGGLFLDSDNDIYDKLPNNQKLMPRSVRDLYR